MIIQEGGEVLANSTSAPYNYSGDWFELIGCNMAISIAFDGNPAVTLFPGDLIKLKFSSFTITNLTSFPLAWEARIGQNGTPPIEKGNQGHRALFAYTVQNTNCAANVATKIFSVSPFLLSQDGINEVVSVIVQFEVAGYLGINNAVAAAVGYHMTADQSVELPAGQDLWAFVPAGGNVDVIPLCR